MLVIWTARQEVDHRQGYQVRILQLQFTKQLLSHPSRFGFHAEISPGPLRTTR